MVTKAGYDLRTSEPRLLRNKQFLCITYPGHAHVQTVLRRQLSFKMALPPYLDDPSMDVDPSLYARKQKQLLFLQSTAEQSCVGTAIRKLELQVTASSRFVQRDSGTTCRRGTAEHAAKDATPPHIRTDLKDFKKSRAFVAHAC